MFTRSRQWQIFLFALFGFLIIFLLYGINFILSEYITNNEDTWEVIDYVQFYLSPGWVYHTLLLARADGTSYMLDPYVMFVVNSLYWGVIGAFITSPRPRLISLKVLGSLFLMFVLSEIILRIHGG